MGYVLTSRAMDIETTEKELCYILGYLATPKRIKYIEAQVPYGKEDAFRRAYPGQNFDKMKSTSDKQSYQFRIILNYNGNCPEPLRQALTIGGGAFDNNCISRGRFVEKIINVYGFKFFDSPDAKLIRHNVEIRHPDCVNLFEQGYSIPLSERC